VSAATTATGATRTRGANARDKTATTPEERHAGTEGTAISRTGAAADGEEMVVTAGALVVEGATGRNRPRRP